MLVLCVMTSTAQVVYVDPSASGTGDGASWTNAMTDLQTAIDAAATVATSSNPIQVWVKSGTYKATTGTDRTIRFKAKNYVEMYGGFSGTETSIAQRDIRSNPTIISGDIGVLGDKTDNSQGLFLVDAGVNGPLLFDGFEFEEAYDPNGVVTIGLIYLETGASPTEYIFRNSTFSNNDISFGSVVGLTSFPVAFYSCRFFNNGSPGINRTLWMTSSLEVVNSLFIGNNGPIYIQSGTASIVNTTFYNNSGDAIYLQDQATPIISSLYNNIFWQNTGTDISVNGNASVNLTAVNNLTEDPFTFGINTISEDPQFFDAANNDLRITHCSPAVDQGDNSQIASFTEDLFGDARVFNTTVDLGAYENQVTPIFYSAVEVGDAKCNGGNDGQISVNAGGGTGSPITYSIDGTNFSSNSVFAGLGAGSYTVYASDGVCTYSEVFTVNEPTAITVDVSVTQGTTSNDLTISASGGAGLFQYSIDGTNFQSSGTFSVSSGQTTVYAKDANNCIESKVISVSSDGRLVVYVDPTATGSASGGSWTDAFTDLQTAIDAAGTLATASSQVEVWVKSGTYYPDIQSSTDRTKTIELRNNVLVYGGFAGSETLKSQRDIENNLTILSGDIGVANDSTDNSYGIVTVGNDVTDATTLDGFQLEGAFALSIEPTNGALHLTGDVGEVFVRNCTFTNNLSNEGACIRTKEVSNTGSKITIVSSRFFNNGFYTSSGYIGSAIYAKNQVNVYNSLFIKNKSGVGGVFYLSDGQLDLVNNTFYENSAGNGSFIYFIDTNPTTHVNLRNSIVWDNFSLTGGAVYGLASTGQLTATNVLTQQPQITLNGTNILMGDPQFEDEATYDLNLKHCSPAVDAGDDTVVPTEVTADLLGDPRFFNTVDLGAYENQNDPISISLVSQTNVSCNGLSDGQLEVTATGGTGATLEYSIDGTSFSASPVFPGLVAGSYTVTVRDPGNDCEVTESFTITQPDAISITAAAIDISCNGLTDGVISGTVSGGVEPYQIFLDATLLETGITSTFTIDNLAAGTYALSVTDDSGCSVNFSTSLAIAEPVALAATATATDVPCNGDATGEIVVSPTGGTMPYEYSLDGISFQSSNTFGSLPADNYSLTVRDANGCLTSVNQTVSEPLPLTAGLDSFTDVTCSGGDDGELDTEADGGTAPYTFSLDGVNFSPNAVFSNLVAGNYTITVRDNNGCTASMNATISEPDALSASVSVTETSLCGLSDGELTVTASSGTSPYVYSLDGGTTTQTFSTFSGLSAGAYTITVIDNNGCEITLNESVDDPVTATVSTTQADVLCNGDVTGSITVNVSGGTTPITYKLNGGAPQSSNLFENLSAGSYAIEVEEGNGCIQSVTVDIIEPTAITASSNVTDVICGGDASGEIEVTVNGGTTPYEYSIDGTTFQSSNIISALNAGNYTVTVRDANSCVITLNQVINEPTVLTITVDEVNDAACNGQNDGSISVSGAGGSSPYEFSLDGGAFGVSGEFTNLIAGDYTITVRDANGCEKELSQTVANQFTITATAALVDPLCSGDSNGEITLNTSGGVAPYEYFISGSATSQASPIFSGLASGTYVLRVIDANGCQAGLTVDLTDPQVLSSQTSITQVSCNGDGDGSMDIVVSGGTSPYEYSIDGTTFQSSSSFTALTSGTYTVLVSDANDCEITEAVTITEPDALSLSVTQNGRKGFTVSASGGTGPYEYSSDGSTFQSSGTFTDLEPGSYTFRVRDANGCTTSTETFEVVLGIAESEVSIYPNPSVDFLMIKGIAFDEAVIFALDGKQELRTSTKKIEVKELTEGVHILKLYRQGKEVHHQRIIVN